MSYIPKDTQTDDLETTFRICENAEKEKRGGWSMAVENKRLLMEHYKTFGTNGLVKGFHWVKDLTFERKSKDGNEFVIVRTPFENKDVVQQYIHNFLREAFDVPYILEKPEIKPPAENMDAVPWSKLTFKEVEDSGMMPELSTHISEMEKSKAIEYAKYLKHWCGFPDDFLQGVKEMKNTQEEKKFDTPLDT